MPTPFGINYTVVGEQAVEHRMLGIADRAVDGRPVLMRIAEMMRAAETELFDSQGHGTWPALSDATVLAKASAGLDPRILHATLALRQSLTESGGDNVEIITGEELHFGTTVEYAGYHQTGTSRMPRRKPLTFTTPQIRSFTREVQRFLVSEDAAAVTAAGGGNVPFGLV